MQPAEFSVPKNRGKNGSESSKWALRGAERTAAIRITRKLEFPVWLIRQEIGCELYFWAEQLKGSVESAVCTIRTCPESAD
jgi:hypothetical protein